MPPKCTQTETGYSLSLPKTDRLRMLVVHDQLELIAKWLPLVEDWPKACDSLRSVLEFFGPIDDQRKELREREQRKPKPRKNLAVFEGLSGAADGKPERASGDDDGQRGADDSSLSGDEVQPDQRSVEGAGEEATLAGEAS